MTDAEYTYGSYMGRWAELHLAITHAIQLHGDRFDADPTNWELVADAREFIEGVEAALDIIDPKGEA